MKDAELKMRAKNLPVSGRKITFLYVISTLSCLEIVIMLTYIN